MAVAVAMPKQGITVESCILTKWNVKVGDTVKEGDVLFSFETDKSSIDFISEASGEILATFFNEGDEVPVLVNVAVIGKKGEDVSSFAPNGNSNCATEVKVEDKKEVAIDSKPAVDLSKINANPVTMPKSGITVESCILTKFSVKVGDTVKKGDALFSYETDKSSFDLESEFDGEVLAIFYKEGDEIPVGNNVLVVGAHGENGEAFSPNSSAPVATEVKVENKEVKPQVSATATVSQNNDGKIFASPRAKVLADKLGVSLDSATPTGPNGRIIERDIRLASVSPKEVSDVKTETSAVKVEAPADVKAFTDEKMPNIRKVIAKNMMMSLSSMAQLTHNISFDCTNIMAFRKYLKDNAEKLKLPNITVNNIIVFAVSRVILAHKDLNANLINGDTMRYFAHANVGIATDTPKGLLVPTLFGADTLSLSELAVKSKKLSQDAIDGKISPDLLSGGSFTVSNVGIFGIESFTPVINPPQTGILGVNTMETKIKLGLNNEIIPYTAMNLSLTYDHRALDGAPASRFLKELKDYLENFSLNIITDKFGL